MTGDNKNKKWERTHSNPTTCKSKHSLGSGRADILGCVKQQTLYIFLKGAELDLVILLHCDLSTDELGNGVHKQVGISGVKSKTCSVEKEHS